ncbi:MAG: hypothetical protein RBR86_06050 [Pseudobdellovibrionaceae bacterium]|jgi:hypothetical protein|nr:hypothetical protein [Pseudobdellovibrionaceae bacterium]
MGSFASALTPIMQIGSAISSVASFSKPYVAQSQSNAQADLELKQLELRSEQQKKQNLLNYQQAETARRSRLQRLLSAQRAEFGGGGVGSGAGSGEAVLTGFAADSDIERQFNEKDYQLDNQTLDLRVAQQRQLNLLQKQQLKDKTFLNSLTDIF